MQSLSLIKPVRSVLWSVALLLLGNGLLNTLLTLRGVDEGFSSAMLGLVMSGYFVGFICGTWLSGRLIRRMGHIRTFAFCASICASAALFHLIFIDPWAWLVIRFIYGLAYITMMTVIESWLNSQAARHERGKLFGFYMVVNLGALAVAQQLIRIDSPQSFLLFALVSILISWALLPLTLTRRDQPTISDRPKSSLKTLIQFAPLAVAASFLSGLAMGAFWAMTPIFATLQGLGTGEIALIMTLTILGGALLQIPIGRYSDNHDRPRVLTWVLILACLVSFALSLASGFIALVSLFFIWGGLAFSIYPLAIAMLLDQLHPDEIVSGSADMLMLHGAGCACAPLIAGGLMNIIGSVGLPIYITVVLGILSAYAVYRRKRVTDLVAGDSARFEPMVQTTDQALSLVFDQPQRDLFDDPSFYGEEERQRILKALKERQE